MKLTNNKPGDRGVNLKNGTTVWIAPGETATFDEGDVANVHADLNGAALDRHTKAELLDIAKGEEVEVTDKATKADIIAAIEAKRAA